MIAGTAHEISRPSMSPLSRLFMAGFLMLCTTVGLGQTVPSAGSRTQQVTSVDSGVPTTDFVKKDATSGFLEPGADPENKLFWPFLKHMAEDQKQFWASPK